MRAGLKVATIQRIVALSAVTVSLAWGLAAVAADRLWFGPAGGLLLLAAYAAVIGLEFLWLARRHGEPTRPSVGRLVRAWLIEVGHGPRVFGWRQPFRQRTHVDRLDIPDTLTRGVVLVHGFFCNRGVWNGWLRRLADAGVPYVAVDLEPPFSSIATHADTIDDAVRRVAAASAGRAPVIVAHSMGGLAVRAWLAGAPQQRTAQVHRVVTIGTPHRGTWLARFARTVDGREMRIGSRFLEELTARESAVERQRFTCFWSDCDNIVFPSANATLEGADNRAVAGWAHVHLVEHPAIFAAVLSAVAEVDQMS